jgi:S1-C subfamily serine protease
VGLERGEGGARIFSVAPNSTAAAAEIRVGDVLEAVDGQPTPSSELVISLMGRHKAGETVAIQLLARAIAARLPRR